jgi:hypothetical protein
MTALVLSTAPFIAMVTPKVRILHRRIKKALDAFVEARVRNAVPEWQLRRAQREVDRCRRMMRAGK